ncbi:MAG: MBL fold metallo-hydrolase [Desulfobacterales bacterium]|nr:MBL fold metallo-hydrolase [Desulfobacterales bacterium]MCP4159153.1 MBL fold metallo-hydrolase [Deltaproteobacteria bacterium]
MKIGKYDCSSIEMGKFVLDGGAMFGVVPKVLWEREIPADYKNRIPMSARCLLIQGDNKKILVDTGMGNKFSDKEKKIYGLKEVFDIESKLSELNLSCKDITDVILTHLHFDHAGGATKIENGKIIPTFQNAQYHVQKEHFHSALNPTKRDKASFIKDNFEPLMNHGVLKTLDGFCELFEDIEFIITKGHTNFQQHPLIKGENNSLFFCGDIFPTASHLPVSWHMGYDNNPLTILDEKENLLKRALNEKWIMFFEHDPKIPAVTLKEGKKGIEIDQVIEI